MADRFDAAGRAIAGLLGYNPGPGIYSRLERAIEAMPENVRVQELPGLLKRHKEGVPGWELKATDLDQAIAGRDVVPREELLAAVRERSPVYTHREVVLGGAPPMRVERDLSEGSEWLEPARQDKPSPLGYGVSHFAPKYEDYGQGGDKYAELLLLQPGARGGDFGSHWGNRSAVAHARYDIHGDALRINELQSDLGIHNRKMRKGGPPPEYAGGDGPFDFMPPPSEEEMAAMRARGRVLPFPLEDAWADILIKRLALEAARGGHRAIEVASPRAIADKVRGKIDNYEHFYGNVVPGAIERLGRKMGGLVDDTDAPLEVAAWRARGNYNDELNSHIDRLVALADLPDVEGTKLSGLRHAAERLLGDLGANTYRLQSGRYPQTFPVMDIQRNIAEKLAAIVGPHRMNEMHLRANEIAAAEAARKHAIDSVTDTPLPTNLNPPGRRYLMSDEMRRRILTQGIGAAIGGGLVTDGLMEGQQ